MAKRRRKRSRRGEIDVRAILQELGMTRAELAKELGVNPATVGRWERGEDGLNDENREAFWDFVAKSRGSDTDKDSRIADLEQENRDLKAVIRILSQQID